MATPEATGSPVVIVVSGPSGVGKDAVLTRVRELAAFAVPVTMTTRAPRDGEIDGREYHFVSREAFFAHIEAGELLEHAEVYGNLYGVPRSELRRALDAGQDVIMRVDVQGCRTLRALLPGAVFIIIVPDHPDRLAAYLRGRGETGEVLERRLAAAAEELADSALFDHVVVNIDGDLDAAAGRVIAIAAAERSRPRRAPIVL